MAALLPDNDPRPEAYRATVHVNRLLQGALEQLQDAQRLEHVPQSLRDALTELTIQVAQVKGVCEWVIEDLVVLPADGEDEDADQPAES